MTGSISLTQFSESQAFIQDASLLNAIIARQKSATANSADPSSVEKRDPQQVMDQVEATHKGELDTLLIPVRAKIRTKWWGPQGRALPEHLRNELIKPYTENCVAPSKSLHTLLTPTGWLLIRSFLHPLVKAKSEGTLPPLIMEDDHSLFRSIISRSKSNSGYQGFTTELSRDPSLVRRSFIALHHNEITDPYIQWYRDMRNKFRAIFGGSLTHLIHSEKYLGRALRDYLKSLQPVAYHSELQTAVEVSRFVRRHSKSGVVAVECDYEQMDAHTTCDLCAEALEIYLSLIGFSTDEISQAVRALREYFHLRIIGLDARVLCPSETTLLSGIFPTNGIENIINVFIQCGALGRLVDLYGVQLPQFLLKVMGDDSALLLATEDMELVRLFVEEFMAFSQACGEVVNRLKQGISTDIFCFCRRYYPLHNYRGLKYFSASDGVQVPYPVYPLDYVANSSRYPEDGPTFSTDGLGYGEMKRIITIYDNAYGDPLWKAAVQRLVALNGRDFMLDAALDGTKLRSTWREKVYGSEGWAPEYSHTLQFIAKNCK